MSPRGSGEAGPRISAGRFEIRVPLRTPSKNDIKPGPHFQAWIRERAITKRWFREIPPAGLHRARGARVLHVTVLLARGQKHYDILNLYAGLGPIADALVRRGWLKNDNRRFLPRVKAVEVRLPNGTHAETIISLRDCAPSLLVKGKSTV